MGFIAIPESVKGEGFIGCKTDQDCYTAQKITTPEEKAKNCCAHVGIKSMPDSLAAMTKMYAGLLKVPVIE